ncbi:MAG: Rne/Rng family ribonuclease [Bacteroidetes bacterium]|nr:Rne/Rng family ribonuclease [Bacteroidota bacterium]
MPKEIIINTTSDETRIAIVEEGKLVEFHIESPESERTLGDIFLGRIEAFRSGLQAAFVSIGEDQQGFLHFSDLAANLEQQLAFVQQKKPQVSRVMEEWANAHPPEKSDPQRRRWGDANLLKPKQNILVTITKEPHHSKNPRLSTDISLAGRFLVLIPLSESSAVSRRIVDRKERNRLRTILKKIRPAGFGLIARTVAEGRDEKALDKDLQFLLDRWQNIEKSLQGHPSAPIRVYEDVSLASSIIRDLFSDDFSRILVDNYRMYRAIRGYILAVAPHLIETVKQHKGKKPVFAVAGVQEQINEVFDTQVQLPSGGSIVIEATEAMHVIDVNSGRTRTKKNHETLALQVNLEAVESIARQIRLRNLSGLIVIDFIDLRFEKNRQKIDTALSAELQSDRIQAENLPMSELGIVQMTRERQRDSVTSTHQLAKKSQVNRIPSPDPDFMTKKIGQWLEKHSGGSVYLKVHPFTAAWMERGLLGSSLKAQWQRTYKHRIKIVADESMPVDAFRFLDATSEHDITDLSPRMVRIKAQSQKSSLTQSKSVSKKRKAKAPSKSHSKTHKDPNSQQKRRRRRSRQRQKTSVNV